MASSRLQAAHLGLVLALGLGLAPTVAASIPDTQGIADDLLSRLSEPRPELDVSEPACVACDAPSLPETRVRGFRLFDPLSRPGYNGVSRANATRSTFGLWGNRVGPVQKGLWTDPVTGAAYARARWYDARNGVFLTEDPMDDLDSPNLYAFVGWSPSMHTDPTGEYLETAWDVASLTLGLVSLRHNLKEGNYGMAALDAFGVAVDGLATALPIVPGGAGAAIKASRAAGWLGKAQYVDQASNVAQGALQAAVSYEEGDTGMAAFYGGMSALGVRGMAKSPFKVETRGMGSSGGNFKIVPKAGDTARITSVPSRSGIVGRGDAALEFVPSKYRAAVGRSFRGEPVAETLAEDLVVFRHWGGKATEIGSPWFSPKSYVRPGNARRYLALPGSNTAEKLTAFKIPAGTTILRGKVASQAGEIGFGSKAVGGGVQIYTPDPSVVVPIR